MLQVNFGMPQIAVSISCVCLHLRHLLRSKRMLSAASCHDNAIFLNHTDTCRPLEVVREYEHEGNEPSTILQRSVFMKFSDQLYLMSL